MRTMSVRLSIGEFSRMTHLSIKALRHYHDVGLLGPADIDPQSGYRYYQTDQIPTAQVIRRFRDLGMPLDEIRAVVTAPELAERNEVILSHLRRMETQLEQTQATVASLRGLLERPPDPVSVEYRSVPPTPAVAITDLVVVADAEEWWMGAFDELYGLLAAARILPAGSGGALWPGEYFEEEKGECTVFVPVATVEPGALAGNGRAEPFVVPAAELAVALHHGSFADIDQTYGALGSHVAEREIGLEGPIRENYLVTIRDTPDESRHRIEVCWPVFRTGA
jgi:DNA-binding transcriptional MerR regulator